MGMKLKNASPIFMITLACIIMVTGFIINERDGSNKRPVVTSILKIKALAAARKIFVTGPAMATHIMPFSGSLKLSGFTGTGFAHPIIRVIKIQGCRWGQDA